MTVEADGAYVATWERDEAIWDSPEQALDAINAVRECQSEYRLGFLGQFATHAEFEAHPSVRTGSSERYDYAWWFAQGSAESAALAECGESGWSTVQVHIEADDSRSKIRIPLSLIGSGTHRIFFASLEYPDFPSPHRHRAAVAARSQRHLEEPAPGAGAE